MKSLNIFILERLKINKDIKVREFCIIIPYNNDYNRLIKQYKENFVFSQHNDNCFILDLDTAKELSNKFDCTFTKIYKIPNNISIEDFKEDYEDGTITIEDLEELEL